MGNNSAPPTQPGPLGSPTGGAKPLYDSPLAGYLSDSDPTPQPTPAPTPAPPTRKSFQDAFRKATGNPDT